MKQSICLLIVVMFLSGCATAPLAIGTVDINNKTVMTNIFNKQKGWDEKTRDSFINGELQVGMTILQVLYLQGVPLYWSKHKVGEDIYETWSVQYLASIPTLSDCWTCDFKNGILTGYSTKARYYSSEGVEDLRDLK